MLSQLSGITLQFVLYYLPAFIANSTPTLARGTHRIDFGRKFINGVDILGEGKTFEGLLYGLLSGYTLGLIVLYLAIVCNVYVSNALLPFLSVTGALLGDIIGAFVKRRMRIPRGASAPILDQLDFVVGATILMRLVDISVSVEVTVFSMILALILHPITNKIAYIFKLKDVPW